jgi:hypothetical protein
MTCRDARRALLDRFDTTPPPAGALDEHLSACSECAREYASLNDAFAAVLPSRTVHASADFKERVMNELASQVSAAAVAAPRRFRFPRWLAVAAVAAAIVVAIPVVGTFTGGRTAPLSAGAGVFAQSIEAMSNLHTVHIKALMRGIVRDNFESIQLDGAMVAVDLRKQFTPAERWRVEKPGRVVVMDGQSSLLFIEPNIAVRGGTRTGFIHWLRPLLDPESILRGELDAVRARRAQAAVSHESGQMILRVRREAAGEFEHAWMRNRTITGSDHTCIYRFDEQSKRLLGLEVIVHASHGDVPVFRTTSVEYDQAFDPALFHLTLPQDVNWSVPAGQMPVTAPLPRSAREAAVLFFESCANQDWNALLTVHSFSTVDDAVKSKCTGLKVISIGDAFQSGQYPGWFVPYEVRLKGGSVRKWNLALRNDNAAGRWHWDGGF